MLFLTNLAVLLLPLTLAAAQTTSQELTAPSPAASGARPGPNSHGYTYAGCWNETTGITGSGGARALANGGMISSETLTTESCLNYCANASYAFCGMQYGRECWGAAYLSSLSMPLNASNCSFACQGNSSEVCGGSLTISLFNLTGKAKSSLTSTGSDGGTSTNAAAPGTRTFFSAIFAAEYGFGLWSSAALSGVALVAMVAL